MTPFEEQLSEMKLILDARALEEVRAALRERMAQGLTVDGAEISMIPTFLAPPRLATGGEALAVDAGGTHLRAARVRLHPGGGGEILGKVAQLPLPGAVGRPAATSQEFLEAHLDLLESVGARSHDPLGYCFSYPIRSLPGGDAILERWTKEVRVDGLVGQPVGAMLSQAARRRGLDLGPIVVLNDTIATLLAGSLNPGFDPASAVGLIVGTGTNMGSYLELTRIGKLAPAAAGRHERMALNFESGAFSPPGLGPADQALDERSINPGRQRFEKAISGAYLGALFDASRRLLGLQLVSEATSALVSRLAVEEQGRESELARALLRRAADLVAAALAATHDLLGSDRDLHVNAEGTLFWRGPGFAERVDQTLAALLQERGCRGRFTQGEGANFLGSARAALG